MRIIDLPTRLFETGDRVRTEYGSGYVVHDELEGILNDHDREGVSECWHERCAVIVRLDKPAPDDREEIELSRGDVTLEEKK